jgi:hypothetical protein
VHLPAEENTNQKGRPSYVKDSKRSQHGRPLALTSHIRLWCAAAQGLAGDQ